MGPMMQHEVLDDLIIEQAVRRAKQSGWVVIPEHCAVHAVASDAEVLRTGEAHAWIVYLSVQPFYNPGLQKPLRLECRVELLGECLCVVELQAHPARMSHVV